MWSCRSNSFVVKTWFKLAARHLRGLKRCRHEKALAGRAFYFVAALDWRSVHLFLAEEAGFEPAVGITPRTLSRRMT